jgi:hypothetical protein
MKHRHWVAMMLLAVAVAGAPRATLAGPSSSDNLLELAGRGGPSVGLGFGVPRLQWQSIAPLPALSGSTGGDTPTSAELEHSRALSFDVKLGWPGADPPMGFEPYAVVGPALFVDSPYDTYGMVGAAGDQHLRLGARVGAGFNWRVRRDVTLFGSYDVTTTPFEGATPLGLRTPAASSPTSYDALYGIRFRY